jgi:hypothetical protein
MTNIVKFGSANLPALADLSSSLKNLERSVPGVGTAILKMDKTGAWVFGANHTEVEDNSEWAVNPNSFVHGYICWGRREVLAEILRPISEPLPELPLPPAGSDKGWEAQVGMHLHCLSGQDAGVEVKYTATSMGGRNSVGKLALQVGARIDEEQANGVPKEKMTPVAVVTLQSDSYKHREYGKVFTPVFNVIRWISLEGDKAEAPAAEAPETTPRRRRTV